MRKLASQAEAQSQLELAFTKGVYPQSLLIEGQAGIGKKLFAIDWARLLICEKPQTSVEQNGISQLKLCGECFACRSFKKTEASPHIHIIPPLGTIKDKTKKKEIVATALRIEQILENPFHVHTIQSNDDIKIDQIREIHQIAAYKRAETQVVIIPEAQKMKVGAANALLKVLEEVPDNMYFILTCSNRSGLLPTILSRCSRIHLPPNSMQEIIEVMSQTTDNPFEPQVLASLADNSIGKCFELIDSGEIDAREKALTYLEHIASETSSRFLLWMKTSGEMEFDRSEALDFINSIELIWSDFLALKKGSPVRNIDLESNLLEHGLEKQPMSFFFEQYHVFEETRKKIGSNAHVANILVTLGLKIKGALV